MSALFLATLALAAVPQTARGAGPSAAPLSLECVVSTRYEGYPDGFATPDETIRLRIDRAGRSLAYWDGAVGAYAVVSDAAVGDWSTAFRFDDGAGGVTEIAGDGSRYRNLSSSPDGRAETAGSCRPAG
jgi:hypothetical protein